MSIFLTFQGPLIWLNTLFFVSKLSLFGVHGVPLEWLRSHSVRQISAMFRLMILLPLFCLYWKVSHKALCLDHFCFYFTLMILLMFVIAMFTLFFLADDSNFFLATVDFPSATSIAQGLLDKIKYWCWSNGMALNAAERIPLSMFKWPLTVWGTYRSQSPWLMGRIS